MISEAAVILNPVSREYRSPFLPARWQCREVRGRSCPLRVSRPRCGGQCQGCLFCFEDYCQWVRPISYLLFNGRKVTRKMEINIYHWNYLRITTTRGAAFHAKTRAPAMARNTTMAFFPILLRPSVSPIETVVLPSPAGVGFTALTNIMGCFAAPYFRQ